MVTEVRIAINLEVLTGKENGVNILGTRNVHIMIWLGVYNVYIF